MHAFLFIANNNKSIENNNKSIENNNSNGIIKLKRRRV